MDFSALLCVLRGKKIWSPLESKQMPEGYYVPFSAIIDAPYWLYKFGQGPNASNSAGIIPKDGLINVQGPAGAWGGTHQSAYLMGVGRIIVKIGDFRPAPALATNS
jgi:hypothetical protein